MNRHVRFGLLIVSSLFCGAGAVSADVVSNRSAKSEPTPRRRVEVDKTGFIVEGQPFMIKGMAYSPFYPGESNRDKTKKADIASDMRKMRNELGVNTLLVYWTRPEPIYQQARSNGLLILHGIWIDQEPDDFHDARFKEGAKRQVRHAMDYIHNLNGTDYSDTILAFWIGGELNPASIDGTDSKHPEIDQFEGTYYKTRKGASATECFMAEICDYARCYANEKYGRDYLFSHINWPPTEPWLKTDFLDYAMFDVYSFWPPEVSAHKKGSFAPTSYQGYVEHLKKSYPNMPLLISEFGMSTAPDNVTTSGNNERDQASELIARWHDIMTAAQPLAGGMIFEWNDEWWKQSGAAVLVDLDTDKHHHERDDAEEWFGLIGIDGESHVKYEVRPKPAYFAVQRMFNPSFYENRRSIEPIVIQQTPDEKTGRMALAEGEKALDASKQLHVVLWTQGDENALKATRIRLDAKKRLDRDDQTWGDSLPLSRYLTAKSEEKDGWRRVRIPMEHFGPLDFAALVSIAPVVVTEGEGDAPPLAQIKDVEFIPNY